MAWQRTGGGSITLVTTSPAELWLAAGIAVVGVLLYLAGSPLSPGEDQMHIAVARRLAALADPSVHNVYMTPEMVYTYPFPTTHVIFALTSLIGGVDVLFVYHKLRFIWAVLSILCVFAAAKELFDDARIAVVCGWTGVVFVVNGVFGHVPNLMWAQLAPFSHASDIAMGVLLPLLLVSTFRFLAETNRRDSAILAGVSLLMVLALTTAHIKETTQYLGLPGRLSWRHRASPPMASPVAEDGVSAGRNPGHSRCLPPLSPPDRGARRRDRRGQPEPHLGDVVEDDPKHALVTAAQ